MKVFVLEDDNERIRYFKETFNDVDLYTNAYDAIRALRKKVYDVILLDNDLGDDAGSGIDVATFLHDTKDNRNNNAIIIVHSWNTPATASIKGLLSRAYCFSYGSFNFKKIIDLLLTKVEL